jgi:hypothetical protein
VLGGWGGAAGAAWGKDAEDHERYGRINFGSVFICLVPSGLQRCESGGGGHELLLPRVDDLSLVLLPAAIASGPVEPSCCAGVPNSYSTAELARFGTLFVRFVLAIKREKPFL